MGRPDFSLTTTYEHPDLGDNERPDPFKEADAALTHAMGTIVFEMFPGHPWEVVAEHAQGMVFVSIPMLMGAKTRGCIPMRYLTTENDSRRAVMKICGEILERYRLPRGQYDQADFLRALTAIPLQRRGFHGLLPV